MAVIKDHTKYHCCLVYDYSSFVVVVGIDGHMNEGLS